jgi:hypothetical protein
MEAHMSLEIESIDVHDIQKASKTHVRDRVLYVNTGEIEELILKDRRTGSVEVNTVRRSNGSAYPSFRPQQCLTWLKWLVLQGYDKAKPFPVYG